MRADGIGRGARKGLGLMSLGLAATTGAGMAQTVPAEVRDADGAVVLQEVVIFAQKRLQTLGEIAASLTLVGGDETGASTPRRENVLAGLPNLTAQPVTAKLYTTFLAIRGVGSALIESDPSVGMNIDGVSLGSSQSYSGTLLDVDRVEVLRGPQGTLYGRNTLGGTVNIVSNRPDATERGGHVALGFGSDARREGEAVVNTPLGDSGWALRGALSAADWDGARTSSISGEDLGGGESRHGRISLSGPLGDTVEFHGFIDMERQDLPGEMFGMPLADWQAGRDTVAIDDASHISSDSDIVSAALTWNLGNGDRIEAQTAWQQSKVTAAGNGFPVGYFAAYDAAFGAVLPGFRYRSDNPFDGTTRQLSQELRYVHEGDRFNWVAGLYAETAHADRAYGATSAFTGGEMVLGSRGVTDTRSLSAFADGTWQVNDRLSVFGGLRAGHDRKRFDYTFHADTFAQMAGLAAAFEPSFSDEFSESYVTPRLGLSYQINPDTLAWASVSGGYKSGGFNAGFVGLGDAGHYEAEKLTAWELGFRSTTMEGQLELEGALFYNDWRDQQVQGFNPATGTTPILNAPESRSAGAELAARVNLDNGFSLRGALGYTDATYKDFTNAPAPGGMGVNDASGNQQQFVSRRSASFGVGYEWAMAQGWTGRADLNWTLRSGYWFDVNNTIRQPGYGLANATVTMGNDRYEVAIWGRNLTDERFVTAASDLGGGMLVSPGEERTVGVNLRMKF